MLSIGGPAGAAAAAEIEEGAGAITTASVWGSSACAALRFVERVLEACGVHSQENTDNERGCSDKGAATAARRVWLALTILSVCVVGGCEVDVGCCG
jgi:hypothetical protein